MQIDSILYAGLLVIVQIWVAFYTIANVPYGSLLSLISYDLSDCASLSA